MIGIGMPRSQRRIPLPMLPPVVGEGLNKRSEFRVPVDQMFAAQAHRYRYLYTDHLRHASERGRVD
jgi:hypothetical protein